MNSALPQNSDNAPNNLLSRRVFLRRLSLSWAIKIAWTMPGRLSSGRFLALAAIGMVLTFGVHPAPGYIDGSPERRTLPQILLEFQPVGVFKVDRLDLERGAVRYQRVDWLQGPEITGDVKHAILYGAQVPKELQVIKPGSLAVLFGPDPYGRGLALVEGVWYISTWDRHEGWWRLAGLFDGNLVFSGSAPELVEAVKRLHRGQDVTVRSLLKRRSTELQWVSYSLREANRKRVVEEPPAKTTISEQAPRATVAELRGHCKRLSLVSVSKPRRTWPVSVPRRSRLRRTWVGSSPRIKIHSCAGPQQWPWVGSALRLGQWCHS